MPDWLSAQTRARRISPASFPEGRAGVRAS